MRRGSYERSPEAVVILTLKEITYLYEETKLMPQQRQEEKSRQEHQ